LSVSSDVGRLLVAPSTARSNSVPAVRTRERRFEHLTLFGACGFAFEHRIARDSNSFHSF
jgi:hypothetical protein